MTDQVYRRSVELLEADINDELVALERTLGACFGFNSVAKDVRRKLETPRAFDDLGNDLPAEYDVAEQQCMDDVRELLEHMTQAKLIEPAAS